MEIAIGLLGGLDGDLLLKELRPVTQRDDLSIKPIEAWQSLRGSRWTGAGSYFSQIML